MAANENERKPRVISISHADKYEPKTKQAILHACTIQALIITQQVRSIRLPVPMAMGGVLYLSASVAYTCEDVYVAVA